MENMDRTSTVSSIDSDTIMNTLLSVFDEESSTDTLALGDVHSKLKMFHGSQRFNSKEAAVLAENEYNKGNQIVFRTTGGTTFHVTCASCGPNECAYFVRYYFN